MVFSQSFKRLESRLSVLDKHLKVCLVPGTSLRRRLERILLTTEGVVAGSRAVRRTVRLTTGLDPDERVDERGASVGGGSDTETGAVDVAPVTPLEAETADGVAASIDVAWLGIPADLSSGEKSSMNFFSFWALFHWASVALENSPGERSQAFQPATLVAIPRTDLGLPAFL
jgi:hypothetical protein